jgi:cytochrome c biogenesis protein CcmG/thiol:disulfide interchange protein DsbE
MAEVMNEVPPKSNRAPLVILGIGLLLGLIGGLVIFGGLPRQWPWAAVAPVGTPGTPAPAPVAGAPAPDFTLMDASGKAVRLWDLKGKVVLINFWATWCSPCQREMPAIQHEFETRREEGFMVLAVDAAETGPHIEADIQAFGDQFGLTFPLLLDPQIVVNDRYRIRGYPTSFFVNRAGVIAAQHVGELTAKQLADYLAKLDLKD